MRNVVNVACVRQEKCKKEFPLLFPFLLTRASNNVYKVWWALRLSNISLSLKSVPPFATGFLAPFPA